MPSVKASARLLHDIQHGRVERIGHAVIAAGFVRDAGTEAFSTSGWSVKLNKCRNWMPSVNASASDCHPHRVPEAGIKGGGSNCGPATNGPVEARPRLPQPQSGVSLNLQALRSCHQQTIFQRQQRQMRYAYTLLARIFLNNGLNQRTNATAQRKCMFQPLKQRLN
jgi:hypothetical protein